MQAVLPSFLKLSPKNADFFLLYWGGEGGAGRLNSLISLGDYFTKYKHTALSFHTYMVCKHSMQEGLLAW